MESFFQACSKLDEIEIKELLLRRYHNIDYILSMDGYEFIFFLNKAMKVETEEKLYMMWLQRFTLMTPETFVSFNDFYDRATGKNIDMRTTQEILDEIDEVEALFERR